MRTLFKAFLAGMLSILPVLAIHLWLKPFWIQNIISLVIIVPIVEEYCKYFFVRKAIRDDPAFDEPIDGVIYATTASLGFAMIENIFYVASARYTGDLASVSLLRALITVPGHALFASIRGYARSVQKFANLAPMSKKAPIYEWLRTKVFPHIKGYVSFSPSTVAFLSSIKSFLLSFHQFFIHTAIWLAIIMHASLNASASLGTTTMGLMLLVMIGLDILFWHLSKKRLHHLFFLPQDTIIRQKSTTSPIISITQTPTIFLWPPVLDTAITAYREKQVEKNIKEGKKLRDWHIARLDAIITDKTKITCTVSETTFKTIHTYRSLIYTYWELSQYPPNNIYLSGIVQTSDDKYILIKPGDTSLSATTISQKVPGGMWKLQEKRKGNIEDIALHEICTDLWNISPTYCISQKLKVIIHTAIGEYRRLRDIHLTIPSTDPLRTSVAIHLYTYDEMCLYLTKESHPGYKTLGNFLSMQKTFR